MQGSAGPGDDGAALRGHAPIEVLLVFGSV